MKSKFKKLSLSLVTAGTVLVSGGMNVFASEGVSDGVVTALTATASDIKTTLGAVAPIGLGIAGTFLVWRYGMKFFKSLSK